MADDKMKESKVTSDETPGKKPDDAKPKEIGGRKEGLDPTRYGDWEKGGRAIDF